MNTIFYFRMISTQTGTLNGFSSKSLTPSKIIKCASTFWINTKWTIFTRWGWRSSSILRGSLSRKISVGTEVVRTSNTTKTAIVKVALTISLISHYPGTTTLLMIMTKSTLPIAILTLTAIFRTFASKLRVILIWETFASVPLFAKP